MKASRRRVWIRRGVLACTVLGLCLLGVSVASMFAVPFYQQPPAAWMPPPGTVTPGVPYTVPPGTPPPGKIRVRLFAGSLIVANGDFRGASVGITLSHSYHAGFTWFWHSPVRAWDLVRRQDVWKWYFYKEHFQVQLFPIGLLLVAPWALRRWVFKERPEWACQKCGYDRRGKPDGPCPECGVVAATKSVG